MDSIPSMEGAPSAPDVEPIASEALSAGQETVSKTVAAGDKMMKDAMARASAVGDQAFKEGMDKSLSALNELNSQTKKNLEAVVASVTAATKGAETLSTQAMSYTKKAMESQVEQARALTGARSVQEVVEMQTTYAKTAMEGYVAELNRISEVMAGVMKDSFRPLNERATALMETIQSAR